MQWRNDTTLPSRGLGANGASSGRPTGNSSGPVFYTFRKSHLLPNPRDVTYRQRKCLSVLAWGTFGADLNCSESSRGSGLGARWFTSPPQCHLQAARSHSLRPPHAPTALASKGPGAASLLMVDC